MYPNSCGILCVAKKLVIQRKEYADMKSTEILIKPNEEVKKRIAAYCRVSTDSMDQKNSFITQIKYYSNYVKTHPQYELVDIYADEGITGTSMKKRDEFKRMLNDCQKGKIDRIVTKSVSRFARNANELISAIRMLKEMDISVFFEEQGIDTDKINVEMLVTLPALSAQQESQNISDNVRWSYKKRMESGQYNTSCPAYGFRMINGELRIKEDEAEVVRRIFDLYLQGYGKQSIANILNKENPDSSRKWYVYGIDYILNNERYMGDAVLQKKYTTETLPFTRKRNRGEKTQYYVENSNVPIISKEIFNAVKQLQNDRKKSSYNRQVSLLSGKVKCADCGKNFRKFTDKDKIYWVCSYRTTSRSECNTGRIPETDFYDAFTALMSKLKANKKYILDTLIKQIEMLKNRSNPEQESIYRINKEISDLSAKNHMLAKLHTKGILKDAEFTAQVTEISKKLQKLKDEHRKIISEDKNGELLEKLNYLNEVITDYVDDLTFHKDIFQDIVESITVYGNDTLEFRLTGGLELTEKIYRQERSTAV